MTGASYGWFSPPRALPRWKSWPPFTWKSCRGSRMACCRCGRGISLVTAAGIGSSLNGAVHPVRTRLIHDAPGDDDGARVLVDRLWPRGIRKNAASVDQWSVDVAPSTQLRRWYGNKAERFAEFTERYLAELRTAQASQSLDRLGDLARRGPLTLLTATKDLPRSGRGGPRRGDQPAHRRHGRLRSRTCI